MRKLLYYFECIFLSVVFLSSSQSALAQSASQKDDLKKQQLTLPADPRSLGEKQYQELKAKGLIPQPAQVSSSKESAKRNTFTVQGSRPQPPTPQLEIPLDGTFTASMARNDDGSSSLIVIPFTFRFYGTPYDSLYINNNGNVTFGTSYGAYTSSGFPSASVPPMIAPFWADVDTRNTASGIVYHKIETHRITIIWDHVGYYNEQVDKLNTFELILSDGTDATVGIGKNICFSYDDMQWTTGSASGGVGGFGGTPATVGVNRGDGVQYSQLGRFDHAGTDYDGEGGANDGVSYLDNLNFCTGQATITGVVFHDLNGNGVQDPGEPGLPGWTINLLGAATRSTTTNASGIYIFGFLNPGTYTVSEVLQTGWVQTAPPRTYTVTLATGTFSSGNDFGNAHPGSISGQAFFDMNGDGVKDPSESGLAGWTINASGPVNSSAVTDAAGNYALQNLPPGIYILDETLMPGWGETLPVSGSYVAVLYSGGNVTGLDFGNRITVGGQGTVRGSVFDDRNGNGVRDSGEPSLSNWTIELNGRGVRKTLQTGIGGDYLFTGLSQGTYTITQMVPDGWVQTLPSNGLPYNFTLANNADRVGVDFGNRNGVTGVNELAGNPDEYALYQNYPNPFNPTTRISFNLPKDGYVTLKVYNVLGIEVASLFEGRMSAGMHSVAWDAQDVPSGIYVYRLTSGSFTAVKKMVLMK
ncbi:MAG: SdrD B-like domain-containing protein [Bacteroidota bacterium]